MCVCFIFILLFAFCIHFCSFHCYCRRRRRCCCCGFFLVADVYACTHWLGENQALALVNTFHCNFICTMVCRVFVAYVFRFAYMYLSACVCLCMWVYGVRCTCECLVHVCVWESLWRTSTSYLLNYIRCDQSVFGFSIGQLAKRNIRTECIWRACGDF